MVTSNKFSLGEIHTTADENLDDNSGTRRIKTSHRFFIKKKLIRDLTSFYFLNPLITNSDQYLIFP